MKEKPEVGERYLIRSDYSRGHTAVTVMEISPSGLHLSYKADPIAAHVVWTLVEEFQGRIVERLHKKPLPSVPPFYIPPLQIPPLAPMPMGPDKIPQPWTGSPITPEITFGQPAGIPEPKTS